MSLSSRNLASAPAAPSLALLVGAGIVAVIAVAPAGAADIYYQPIVSLSTAYNTNLDLSPDPADRRSAEGYYADAATNIGIATPQSDTMLQPRLLYNYYPSASDRNRLEAFLNGNSRYSWQRDRFNITGSFDHRDDVNAEQPAAADTNTVNPGQGNTTPTTGRALVGVTRNYLILDPTYTHLLTPLSGMGVAGEYQRMTYSQDDANHIAYDFYQGRLFYSKTIDLRSDFAVGVYGNRYESKTVNSHSDSGGLQASGGYNWTQTLHSNLTLQYQETRFRETSADRDVSVSSHPWAANFTTVYDAQTSKYTFSLGRTIYPSSAGGLYTTDQVRAQYDKDFTQRLHFTTAIRVFRDRTTSGVANNDYRNYGTGNLRVQYMLTPRLFVATSYSYLYQKYRFDTNSAEANVINVSFGYRGIDRQR
jgi:hypothetical protein